MLTDEDVRQIESHFNLPVFTAMWPEIMRRYRDMGFTDPMTDDQRIEEFQYVQQQYCKYVFSKQDRVLDLVSDVGKLKSHVEELISKAGIREPSRAKLVYATMRDDWLLALYADVMYMFEREEKKKQEVDDDDGWI